jgi:hypothetical protein
MHGADRSVYVPSADQVKQEGFADRFPKDVKTVTAVSVETASTFSCPAVA